MFLRIIPLFILLSTLCGCATKTFQRVPPQNWSSDSSLAPFGDALKNSLRYFDSLPKDTVFTFEDSSYDLKEVKRSYLKLYKFLATISGEQGEQHAKLKSFVDQHFDFFRFGEEAFITGYYEPVLNCSLSKNKRFQYPLYEKPSDLLVLDLLRFYKTLPEGVKPKLTGRLEQQNFVPYHDRDEIDFKGALQDKAEVIAWCDDLLDVFFLQVQGSGALKLPNGETLRVGYAEKNGHPYYSVGKYMVDKGLLTLEEATLFGIKEKLRSHPEVVREVLSSNPSYVFFERRTSTPLGSLGVPVTPRRSVASDPNILPKGVLLLLKTKIPVVETDSSLSPSQWSTFQELVLSQDQGGAIKGAGRVDLFLGQGREAEYIAGNLRERGEVFVLLPKAP